MVDMTRKMFRMHLKFLQNAFRNVFYCFDSSVACLEMDIYLVVCLNFDMCLCLYERCCCCNFHGIFGM